MFVTMDLTQTLLIMDKPMMVVPIELSAQYLCTLPCVQSIFCKLFRIYELGATQTYI